MMMMFLALAVLSAMAATCHGAFQVRTSRPVSSRAICQSRAAQQKTNSLTTSTVPLISRGASFVIPRGVRRVPHGVVLTPCCCSTHTGANITCGATVTGTTEHAPNTLGEASGERFFAFEVEYIDVLEFHQPI